MQPIAVAVGLTVTILAVTALLAGPQFAYLAPHTRVLVRSRRGTPLSDMDAVKIDQRTRHRRCAAWVPVELSGLGGGANEHAS